MSSNKKGAEDPWGPMVRVKRSPKNTTLQLEYLVQYESFRLYDIISFIDSDLFCAIFFSKII